eukprot:gene11684-biopygen11971
MGKCGEVWESIGKVWKSMVKVWDRGKFDSPMSTAGAWLHSVATAYSFAFAVDFSFIAPSVVTSFRIAPHWISACRFSASDEQLCSPLTAMYVFKGVNFRMGGARQGAERLLLNPEALPLERLQSLSVPAVIEQAEQLWEAAAVPDDALVLVVAAEDRKRDGQVLQPVTVRGLVKTVDTHADECLQAAELLQRVDIVDIVVHAAADGHRRGVPDLLIRVQEQLQQRVEPAERPDSDAVLAVPRAVLQHPAAGAGAHRRRSGYRKALGFRAFARKGVGFQFWEMMLLCCTATL